MATTESKIQRLHDAGIITAEHFSGSDRHIIEKLTDEEVETLVKLRAKMGAVPHGKDHLRPNIPV